jgi:hypothetical protein
VFRDEAKQRQAPFAYGAVVAVPQDRLLKIAVQRRDALSRYPRFDEQVDDCPVAMRRQMNIEAVRKCTDLWSGAGEDEPFGITFPPWIFQRGSNASELADNGTRPYSEPHTAAADPRGPIVAPLSVWREVERTYSIYLDRGAVGALRSIFLDDTGPVPSGVNADVLKCLSAEPRCGR